MTRWRAWNGGACPLPDDAVVEAVFLVEGDTPALTQLHASSIDWQTDEDPVICYRVLWRPSRWRWLHRRKPDLLRETAKHSAQSMIPEDDE